MHQSNKIAFGNSKPSRINSAAKDLHRVQQQNPSRHFPEINWLKFAGTRYTFKNYKKIGG